MNSECLSNVASLPAGSNYIATLTASSAGAHASYYHKANDQVTITCQVYPLRPDVSRLCWRSSHPNPLSFYLKVFVKVSVPLQLQVGVEFEASARTQDTSVSFGYHLDVPKANLQFKGRMCGHSGKKGYSLVL